MLQPIVDYAVIKLGTNIVDALRALEDASCKIGFVVDEEDLLVGAFVDGDIRRAIMEGVLPSQEIEVAFNAQPLKVSAKDLSQPAEYFQFPPEYIYFPVVDEKGRLVKVVHRDELVGEERENLAIVMAGGRGKRLYPLTTEIPKPMIKVGDRPILEVIIRQLQRHRFKQFTLSVNYLGEIIKEHFDDGSKLNVDVSYLEEKKPLGTAGSLGLLAQKPTAPVLVMNGDLLVDIDFSDLMNFHEQHDASVTVVTKDHQISIPFGVLELEGDRINQITEKPDHVFNICAGIYVIDPDVLAMIDGENPMDMPQLIEQLVGLDKKPVAYSLSKYWLDVGRHEDLEKAQTYMAGNDKVET